MPVYSNYGLVKPRRVLTETGEVVWNEDYDCPTCHTKYVQDEPEYRVCDDCKCYTTVYLRRFDSKAYLKDGGSGFVTLCQSCITGKAWDAKAPPTRAPWERIHSSTTIGS